MSGTITISPELASQWGLENRKKLELRSGTRIRTANVKIAELSAGRSWQLNTELSSALLLHRKELLIRYQKRTGMIHIGPNVGIFSNFLPSSSGDYDPTSIQAELIYLSRIARQLPGQFYVFTPKSYNAGKDSLRGFSYIHAKGSKGGWRSAQYPIPDVIYDRITSRVTENKKSIRSIKAALAARPELKYFNPFYLNKWQVWQYLRANPDLKPFLPETQLLNRENLSNMSKSYPCLYLKPSGGSLGLGIIRVERQLSGLLNYTIYRGGAHPGQASSAGELLRKTQGSRRQMNYIVQQGISLARIQGSVFDLRIILQKDGQGEWQMTKNVARIAARGSKISNLSRGGRAVAGPRLMQALFNDSELAEQKNLEIFRLCTKIARTIEHKSGKIFGELGLDIGIDQQHQLWLIEVNSKPRKTTETMASQRVMQTSFLRPMEYATFLAGF